MDSAAAFLIGWITAYSMSAPSPKPMTGTIRKASQ